MKKTFLTLVVLFVALSMSAQIQLGIKAGVNIADISGLEESSVKPAFYGGLVLNIKTSEKYTLQPELVYSKQGTTLKGDAADNELEGNTNNLLLDYFSIGIINKFYVAKQLHIIIGPSIDIRAYKNFSRNEGWDLAPPVDVSFIGGLGFDFSKNFTAEIRYKQGIVDVLNHEDIFGVVEGSATNLEARNLNEVFQVGMSYRFDFK